MHLWRAGDEAKVNDYLDDRGLKRRALEAPRPLRPAAAGVDRAGRRGFRGRAILESLSNHIAARGGISTARQGEMPLENPS